MQFLKRLSLIACLWLFVHHVSYAQNGEQSCYPCGNLPNGRYLQQVFPNSSLAVGTGTYTTGVNREFAFYSSVNDRCQARPLVLILGGSGFMIDPNLPLVGSPSGTDAMARFIAQYGYAVVTADYFRDNNVCNSTADAHNTMYKATQEVNAMLKFIIGKQVAGRIDTDHIYVIGQSAGGIAGIGAAYADEALLDAVYPANTIPTAEKGLDFYTKPAFVDLEYNIRSFSMVSSGMHMPSLPDYQLFTDRVRNVDMPMLFVHGEGDATVPYYTGSYGGSVQECRSIDTYLCGGGCMADLFEEAGICYRLVTVETNHHSLSILNPWFSSLLSIAWFNARQYCLECNSQQLRYNEDLELISLLRSMPYEGNLNEGGLTASEPVLDLKVFPNPAQETLHLQLPSTAAGTYEIYTSLGLKVAEGAVEQTTQIDLRTLAVGTYILRVNTPTEMFTKRFVKQ